MHAGGAATGAPVLDIGDRKQLLIDETLVASSTGFALTLHSATAHHEPVLLADRPWEARRLSTGQSVLEHGGVYKMWYTALSCRRPVVPLLRHVQRRNAVDEAVPGPDRHTAAARTTTSSSRGRRGRTTPVSSACSRIPPIRDRAGSSWSTARPLSERAMPPGCPTWSPTTTPRRLEEDPALHLRGVFIRRPALDPEHAASNGGLVHRHPGRRLLGRSHQQVRPVRALESRAVEPLDRALRVG